MNIFSFIINVKYIHEISSIKLNGIFHGFMLQYIFFIDRKVVSLCNPYIFYNIYIFHNIKHAYYSFLGNRDIYS